MFRTTNAINNLDALEKELDDEYSECEFWDDGDDDSDDRECDLHRAVALAGQDTCDDGVVEVSPILLRALITRLRDAETRLAALTQTGADH